MTDLLTENARLRAALEAVVQFQSLTFTGPFAAHNKGRTWKDIMREAMSALATPAPDAVQEAARVLLAAPYSDVQSAFYAIDKARDDDEGPEETFAAALRAIAGDRT